MWRIGKCQILEGFKAKPRSLGFLGTEDKLDGLNSEATWLDILDVVGGYSECEF